MLGEDIKESVKLLEIGELKSLLQLEGDSNGGPIFSIMVEI